MKKSEMYCGYCGHTDEMILTSIPPKVKCLITAECHNLGAACNIEFAPIKHGHWIRGDKVYPELPNDGDYYWYCSECRSQDQHNINVEVPFCWHCGAKMDGVENE